MTTLEFFFVPRSVAIVGTSDRAMTPGNALINNLIRFTYPATIYPVNPQGGSISSLKTYQTISEIPGEIDLVNIEDNLQK